MRIIDRAAVSIRNLVITPGRTLLMFIVIAFSCGFLFLIYSFYMSFKVQVVGQLLKSFPVTMVEIRETPVRRGPAVFPNRKNPLTMATSKPISNLPQVKKVYYEETLRVPCVARVNLPFVQAPFEAPIYGISEEYIQPDIGKPGEFHYDKKARFITALISDQLLDIFNSTYMVSRGLAGFTPENLRLYTVDIYVGRSFLGLTYAKKVLSRRARIMATSIQVQPIGLTLPFEYVRDWNRELLGGKYRDRLSRLIIRADSPEGAEQVAQAAKRAGFRARTGRDAIRRLILIQNIILATGTVLGMLILSLSLVSVGSMMLLSVNEQRPWIGLQRALGAKKSDIYLSILLECLFLSAAACLVGLAVSGAAAGLVNDFIMAHLPRYRMIPDRFFVLDPLTGIFCYAGVCLFSMIATLPAARHAVNLSPIEALQ